MTKAVTKKTKIIRSFLVDAVRAGQQDIVQSATVAFGISRQSINRHLKSLVDEGRLIASGKTKGRVYSLGPVRGHFARYELAGLDEHIVHRKDFGFVFEDLPDNVVEICHYGFTEILNNAIDHSDGENVSVLVARQEDEIIIRIEDDGEGIFKHIARIMGLPDPRESILELSKGKLTTDPDNHSGEGVFFTSRSFDWFHIASGDLTFTHNDKSENDHLLHNNEEKKGTSVLMTIALDSERDLGVIFDEYSSGPDDYSFNKTVVPVRLAAYEGENLVSRSQAKRILTRVERFTCVLLDFSGVDKIGQGFADEVFRVFVNSHPNTEITAVNTTKQIEQMISRARSNI